MIHFYRDVPRLGNVALTRHAQERAQALGIKDSHVQDLLFSGNDTPDGMDVLWRERGRFRMVILLKPTPYRGAALVKTIYEVEEQAKAK